MPHSYQNLCAIKKDIFPLTNETQPLFQSLLIAAFNRSFQHFDLKDLVGLLLLLNENEAESCLPELGTMLTSEEIGSIVTMLIQHEAQNYFLEDKKLFLRGNTILTKLLNLQFTVEDPEFENFLRKNIYPLIVTVFKELSENVGFTWNEIINLKMEEILKNVLCYLTSAQYFKNIPPIIKRNCYTLLNQLKLFSPYPLDQDGPLKQIESSFCAMIGVYFFLRYLNPGIMGCIVDSSFFDLISSLDLNKIVDQLLNLDDQAFKGILAEAKKCLPSDLFDKLNDMSKEERGKKSNLGKLQTLVKYLIQMHTRSAAVSVITTPLTKLSAHDKFEKKQPPWSNNSDPEIWKKTLDQLFKEKDDWQEKMGQFLKNLSAAPIETLPNQRILIRNANGKRINFSKHGFAFNKSLSQKIHQSDPIHFFQPNNPFMFAIQTRNVEKVIWFLQNWSNLNLPCAIEKAYLFSKNHHTSVAVRLVEQKTSTPLQSTTIKGEILSVVPLFQDFDDSSAIQYSCQILLTALSVLKKIESYLTDYKVSKELLNKVTEITIEPFDTKKYDLSPQSPQLFLTTSSAGKWQLKASKNKRDKSEIYNCEIEFCKIMELTLTKLLEKSGNMSVASENEFQFSLLFSNENKVYCDLSFNQLLQVILDLFNRENPGKSHQVYPLLKIISACFVHAAREIMLQKEALDLPQTIIIDQSFLQITLFPRKKPIINNMSDLLEEIATGFVNGDMQQLASLRSGMTNSVTDEIQSSFRSILGLKDSTEVTIDHSLADTILNILLEHLTRTTEPQLFSETYIYGEESYKGEFTRRLLCIQNLRNSLHEYYKPTTREGKEDALRNSRTAFRNACYADIVWIKHLLSPHLANIPVSSQNAVDQISDELYPIFLKHILPIDPPAFSPDEGNLYRKNKTISTFDFWAPAATSSPKKAEASPRPVPKFP